MANFYDKASLVLIPSGTKEGTIFSQKPTNGDGDFTFSRASSATRVNSDGLIEKETQNLLLQSNQFDTTWSPNLVSVTGGQSGYDGSSDAWLLQDTASIGEHRVRQSPSQYDVVTLSVYAKANTLNYLWLRGVNSGINVRAYFNLSTGTLGTSSGTLIDYNIESAGNGWYRCSLTLNQQSGFEYYIGLTDADGSASYIGTGSGSIYIQDAQLEQGLVARDYIETTTSAVYEGITDNIPRLDYTDASCPSLLLEPQRTNLFEQSEYFGGWALNPAGISSIESNYAISPEGLQNAYKVNFVVQSDSDLALVEGHSVTGGSTYAYSIYIKGEGSDIGKDIVIKSKRSGGDSAGTTTLQTLTGEWKRIDFTTTYAANNAAANFYISSNDATSCLIYGAQAELGSYPTSYIPTYGSAVTRNKDFCYDAGNAATFNSTEGVFYFEGSALADDGTNRFLSLSDGTTNNYIYFRYVSTSNQYLFRTQIGGVTINTLSAYLADTTENHKFAFKFKSGDYAMWVDGVEISTDTSSTIFASNVLSNMEFSFPTDGGGGFPSKTKQIMIFNTALTDEELAALTTL